MKEQILAAVKDTLERNTQILADWAGGDWSGETVDVKVSFAAVKQMHAAALKNLDVVLSEILRDCLQPGPCQCKVCQ